MDKNLINIYDTFTIIGLALITNCFSEFLSYVFIYRKKQYKELTKTIETQTKKIDTLKSGLQASIKQSDKKVKKMEAELKDLGFQMTKLRMASAFIIGLFFIFFMSIFSSSYNVRKITYKIGCYSC